MNFRRTRSRYLSICLLKGKSEMAYKKILILIFTLFLMALLVACSSNEGSFYGGEPLDSEKLSEIRSSVFASDSEETTKAESVITEKENETDTVGEKESEIEGESQKVTEIKTESLTEIVTEEITSEEAITTETEDPSNEASEIVYWTEKGEVWHTSANCRYIKNSEVISGTVNEAIESGKERLCSVCEKQ